MSTTLYDRALEAAQGGPNPPVPAPRKDVGLSTTLAEMVSTITGIELTASDVAPNGSRYLIRAGTPNEPGRAWFTLRVPPPGGFGIPELELMRWLCPACGYDIKARAVVADLADLGHAVVAHLTLKHPEVEA